MLQYAHNKSLKAQFLKYDTTVLTVLKNSKTQFSDSTSLFTRIFVLFN